MLSLKIIDKCLRSVIVLSISPDSNSANELVSWFCEKSPQCLYENIEIMSESKH